MPGMDHFMVNSIQFKRFVTKLTVHYELQICPYICVPYWHIFARYCILKKLIQNLQEYQIFVHVHYWSFDFISTVLLWPVLIEGSSMTINLDFRQAILLPLELSTVWRNGFKAGMSSYGGCFQGTVQTLQHGCFNILFVLSLTVLFMVSPDFLNIT